MSYIINDYLQSLMSTFFSSEEGAWHPAAITALGLGALACVRAGALYCQRRNRRSLSFRNNGLTESPDVSGFPRLQALFLTGNRLTEPPYVSGNTRLESLLLNDNQLTHPPDVTLNPQLLALRLDHNQLTRPPDVTLNPQLQTLGLNNNQLTHPPDVSRNSQLEWLDLRNNRLTRSPDVSRNRRLAQLSLTNNQLTELHDSILSLPSTCVVRAERNRFSAEYVAAFQERLRRHRELYPDQGPRVEMSIADAVPVRGVHDSLSHQLEAWIRECPERVEGNVRERFAALLRLAPDIQSTLTRYLARLRRTKDYEDVARENVVRRVLNMVTLANDNEIFRQEMLAAISEGLESCGDRVQITFDKIEILWQFHERELTWEETRTLCIQAARHEQLEKYAKRICEIRRLGDQIETILYFQVHLRGSLRLPISTQNMLYPRCSGVTPEMLIEAERAICAMSDEDLLANSFHWQAYIEKQRPDDVARINARYIGLESNLQEYCAADDKEDFLRRNPDVNAFLERAGRPHEYRRLSDFCLRESRREIARLLQPSTAAS